MNFYLAKVLIVFALNVFLHESLIEEMQADISLNLLPANGAYTSFNIKFLDLLIIIIYWLVIITKF